MSRYDYPEVSEARVRPLTEELLAAQRSRLGRVVRHRHGRWWQESRRGFWEAVHWLARMSPEQAKRPALCWGYRATVDDRASGLSNASLPIHLLTDVAHYNEALLPERARYDLRKLARIGVRIVRVTDMQIFGDQGYALLADWSQRIPRRNLVTPSEERFLEEIERRLGDESWLTVAALDGDTLLGYATGWAVDDCGYINENYVGSAGIKLGLSSALNHEIVEAFKRTGGVARIGCGLHDPNEPGSTNFKIRHGFPLVLVPARVWMLKPAEMIFRARRPLAYYRMTGRDIQRAADGAAT